VVRRFSLPLIYSFDKTEAAIFPMQTLLPKNFFSDLFNLLQALFSACVAAVCSFIPHHCVVTFIKSSEICMLFTLILPKKSAHVLGGVSGVASFKTTDKSLNKTQTAFSPMQIMLPKDFHIFFSELFTYFCLCVVLH